ncbi:MAG: class I SAM-dependent methyltransferase [Micromonosporaceae bacterium]
MSSARVRPHRRPVQQRAAGGSSHSGQDLGRLGDASPVVNVGAGGGSYEPRGRRVVGVEPSAVMLSQRPAGAAPAVCAVAEALPFRDGAFGAAMGVLTLHHWCDRARGLAEMRRVASGPVVLFMRDPHVAPTWWLHHYFPATGRLEASRETPLGDVARVLGSRQRRVGPALRPPARARRTRPRLPRRGSPEMSRAATYLPNSYLPNSRVCYSRVRAV